MIVSFDKGSDRVMVLSDRLPSAGMIRENGTWFVGAFTADDLKNNFEPVTDSIKAEAFFHEALASDPLNPNLTESKPERTDLPKKPLKDISKRTIRQIKKAMETPLVEPINPKVT